MNKNYIVILLLFLGLTASAVNRKYIIQGVSPLKLNGKPVMLFQFKGEKVVKIDTSFVKKGKFYFNGTVDYDRFAMVSCGNYPDSVFSVRLMLEPGSILLQLGKKTDIGGTPLNEVYQTYLNECKVYEDSLKKLGAIVEYDSLKQIELSKKYLKTWEKSRYFEHDFIKENLNNPLGLILLKEAFVRLNEDVFKSIMEVADSSVMADPEIKYLIGWTTYQNEMERQRQEVQGPLIQTKYTDFKLLTLHGDTVRLSSFIGKSTYTLIYFWASWCAPCVNELPYIKEAYGKYKENGLDIISISLDGVKSDWRNAVRKLKSIGIQLCDLKAGQSGIKEAYSFRGIPQIIVVNQDGYIIAQNLRGEWVRSYLKGLFEK
jgi:thiol-disulfide isomerase/thioredoxin